MTLKNQNDKEKSEPCASRENIVCDDPELIECVLKQHLLADDVWLARIESFMQGTQSTPPQFSFDQLLVPSPCKDWLIQLTYGLSQRHDDVYPQRVAWQTPTPISSSGRSYYSYVLFNALQSQYDADSVKFYKGHEMVDGQQIVACLIEVYSGTNVVYLGDLTSQIPLMPPVITVP